MSVIISEDGHPIGFLASTHITILQNFRITWFGTQLLNLDVKSLIILFLLFLFLIFETATDAV